MPRRLERLIGELALFFVFVMVPYRLPDGTMTLGWAWAPPRGECPVQGAMIARILADEAAADIDPQVLEVLQHSRYRPAAVSVRHQRYIHWIIVAGALIVQAMRWNR